MQYVTASDSSNRCHLQLHGLSWRTWIFDDGLIKIASLLVHLRNGLRIIKTRCPGDIYHVLSLTWPRHLQQCVFAPRHNSKYQVPFRFFHLPEWWFHDFVTTVASFDFHRDINTPIAFAALPLSLNLIHNLSALFSNLVEPFVVLFFEIPLLLVLLRSAIWVPVPPTPTSLVLNQ